jgi:hypothetical protein
MRLPVQVFAGGQFSQTSFAGSDMGVGSASTYEVFETTPVGFVQATSWTLDSQFATEKFGKAQGVDQAVDSFVKRELKSALAEFASKTDVVCQQDSTGDIDSVIAYTAGPPATIAVNVPNRFRSNETYLCFQGPNPGGALRGAFQVVSPDALGGVLYISLVAGFTGSPVAGDLIAINGIAANTAGSSINGLAYIQSDPGNTGTYAGLNRLSYPGLLRTPNYDADGQALTAEVGRTAIQLMRLRNGMESEKDFIWYTGADQEQNIEELSLSTQSIIINQVEGKNSVDFIKYDAPKTFVGRKIHVSATAAAGRIDGLQLDHWVKSSVLPGGSDEPTPLAWSGITQWPMYGNSGGLAAATLTYLISYWQMISDNPAAGVYINGLPVPANLPLGSNN